MHGLTGEDVVVERAEVVEVRALIDRLAVDLLGRDELGHARHLVGGRHGQREVDQLDVVARKQHVLRREVAVDHADLRGLDQRFADHLDEVCGEIGRDRSARRDRFLERLCSFEQLEGDPCLVTGYTRALARGDHLGDAARLHALELLELALQSLRHTGQCGDRRRDDLDRHGSAGGLVLRTRHGAGPASAEAGAELES